MPNYHGTNDCLNLFELYSDYADGTTATNLITESSRWLTAEVNNFHESPLPLSGGTYSYYVVRASALENVYLALSKRLDDQYEEETGWWDKYHVRAMDIVDRMRAGKISLEADVSPWERGIGPIEEKANGTVGAPDMGMAESNSAIEGAYYTGHDMPRTFVVELDGEGSTIEGQTFKWKYLHGSKWEDETIDCSWDWTSLGFGAAVRFIDSGTFEAEQQWEIPTNPINYDRNRQHSTRSGYMVRG